MICQEATEQVEVTIAKERDIESIWGLVLAENTHMLALARKLGFSISRIPEENQYELKIELRSIDSD